MKEEYPKCGSIPLKTLKKEWRYTPRHQQPYEKENEKQSPSRIIGKVFQSRKEN
jgi:hypothetical protein